MEVKQQSAQSSSGSQVVQPVASETAVVSTEVVSVSELVQAESATNFVQANLYSSKVVADDTKKLETTRATGNETAQPIQATLDSKGIKITFSGNKTAD